MGLLGMDARMEGGRWRGIDRRVRRGKGEGERGRGKGGKGSEWGCKDAV